MTFIDTSFISDAVQTVLFKPQRRIQTQPASQTTVPLTIIADVTIDEDMHDELVITDHPVEGSNSGTTYISDHAFKRPSELVMRIGFTNSQISSLLSSGVISDINSISANGISANNTVAQYNRLQAIQNSRELCTIVTGKRTYTNMLLQSLSVITESRTETSLLATCRWRQIIFVNTIAVTIVTSDMYTSPINLLSGQQLGSGTNINTAAASTVVGGDVMAGSGGGSFSSTSSGVF